MHPVVTAFWSLPTGVRTALWLGAIEDGTDEQVGEVMSVDARTASARIDRAITALEAVGRWSERDIVAGLRTVNMPIDEDLRTVVALRWAAVTPPERRVPVGWIRVAGAAAVSVAVALGGTVLLRGDSADNRDRPETRGASEFRDSRRDTVEVAFSDNTTSPSTGAVLVAGGPNGSSVLALARSDDRRPPTSSERPAVPSPAPPGTPTPPGAPTPAPPSSSPEPPSPTPSPEPPPTSPESPAPTPQPPASDPSQDPAEPPDAGTDEPSVDSAQATIDAGVVEAGVGEETGVGVGDTEIGDPPEGGDGPSVEVAVPGLPPVELP